MRRLAGPILLGFLAFAGYSVKTNYQSPSVPETSSHSSVRKIKSAQKTRYGQPLSPRLRPAACAEIDRDWLQCTTNTFFGVRSGHSSGLVLEHSDQLRFVIATVPDPIHTDLALSFDRFVEAISQGAQEAGYTFDRAVLPWPSVQENSQSTADGDKETETIRIARQERENTPGLLIFRNSKIPAVLTAVPASSHTGEKHLFVLLVGETPTGGIHNEQFLRAIDIICMNSKQGKCSSDSHIDIIGPTFSGSLYSLNALEHQIASKPRFRIRSGTAMSSRAIRKFISDKFNRDFLTFKDTDEYLIERFVEFAGRDGVEGYQERDIAVISEDETAFGAFHAGSETSPPSTPSDSDAQDDTITAGASEPTNHLDCKEIKQDPPAHRCLLRLYFPRGIALLRAAYQNDAVLSSEAENSTGPHTKLKLNLDSTGSEEDSVPTYAGAQTALSQEAVMMGIVTVLRVHNPHFIILRATDPKDLLFLTRFFRTNYPQDRIITMGADQLFPRDVNDTIFRGVLSLTNYPLLPGQLTNFDLPRPGRVFASTDTAGLFNATLATLMGAEEPYPEDGDERTKEHPTNIPDTWNGCAPNMLARHLPEAQYFEYTPPVFGAAIKGTNFQRPLAWLTVMGDDGYWPLATLPESDKCFGHPEESVTLASANSAFPTPIPLDPSPFNELIIVGLVVFSAIFVYLIWWGDFRSRSMLHQQFALVTDKGRGRLLGVLSLILIAALVLLGRPFSISVLWPLIAILGAVLCVAVFTFLNLRARGQSRGAVAVALASILLSSPLLWISKGHHSVKENILLYRMAWLQSGVSPALPLLFVCAALFAWAWFNLKLLSLFDQRRPLLPRGIPDLPSNDLYGTGGYSLIFTRSPVYWVSAALAIGIVISQDIDPLSLDGTNFNDLYRCLFMLCVILIANTMFSAWETWKDCRTLLLHLDRTPLRWAFRRIEGFSWKPLWGAAGGDQTGAYKPLSRSLDALKHLRASLSQNTLAYLQSRTSLVESNVQQLRSTVAAATRSSKTRELRRRHDDLLYRLYTLQKNLAVLCSLVWLVVLEKAWQADTRLVTTGKQVRKQSSNALQTAFSSESVKSDQGQLAVDDQSILLAEEFISLTYLNFIHRVLLRLRWLILAGTSAYVFLLFSVKLYPFEPQGRINGLLILLFLAIASVVYLIYSQMHRDATLSHLTKKTPGELGADFWIRIIGVGAVPVFSLLATQIPALNRFFYSWLKPVLDALHRS